MDSNSFWLIIVPMLGVCFVVFFDFMHFPLWWAVNILCPPLPDLSDERLTFSQCTEGYAEILFGTWVLLVSLMLWRMFFAVFFWPDSFSLASVLFAQAFGTSFVLGLWRARLLARPTAAKVFSLICVGGILVASVLAGPFGSKVMADEAGIAFLFFLISAFVTPQFSFYLLLSTIVLGLIEDMGLAIQAPLFCVHCIAEGSRLNGFTIACSTLGLYSHMTVSWTLIQRFVFHQFQRAAKMKDDFVAQVAHDVRTPLNGIVGCGAFLRADTSNLTEGQREHLAVIYHCTSVMQLLVENILAHGAVGPPSVTESVIDTQAFFGNLYAFLWSLVYKTNVAIAFDYESPVPEKMQIASSALSQVLYNLGSNAIKFQAGSGAGVLQVAIRYDGTAGMLRCQVKDRGPGIRPDFAKNGLFLPYQRDAHNIDASGTGLGLSICKRLCEAVRGSIEYAPNAGGGSVFTVAFPARAASPKMIMPKRKASAPIALAPNNFEELERFYVDDLSPYAPSGGSSGDTSAAQALEVLIVEDNAVNVTVLRGMLRRMALSHVKTTVLEDGVSALEYLLARSKAAAVSRAPLPALVVLMDWRMPVMDGLHASKIWRDIEAAMGITPAKIVAVTAGLTADLPPQFDAGIGKPVRFAEIQAVIASALKDISGAPVPATPTKSSTEEMSGNNIMSAGNIRTSNNNIVVKNNDNNNNNNGDNNNHNNVRSSSSSLVTEGKSPDDSSTESAAFVSKDKTE